MAVQLHTKLYGSPATHQTLQQSSYTPTLRQSSYTPNSTAVQLHTKLYGSPATHQTLQQQGGTGKDSYIHLADWTLSVAAIEKNPISTLYLLLSVPSISLSLTVSSPLLLLVPSASYCQSLVPLTVSTLCESISYCQSFVPLTVTVSVYTYYVSTTLWQQCAANSKQKVVCENVQKFTGCQTHKHDNVTTYKMN